MRVVRVGDARKRAPRGTIGGTTDFSPTLATESGRVERMFLAGVQVPDRLVLELAHRLDDEQLKTRLRSALAHDIKLLALDTDERETILAAHSPTRQRGSKSSAECYCRSTRDGSPAASTRVARRPARSPRPARPARPH